RAVAAPPVAAPVRAVRAVRRARRVRLPPDARLPGGVPDDRRDRGLAPRAPRGTPGAVVATSAPAARTARRAGRRPARRRRPTGRIGAGAGRGREARLGAHRAAPGSQPPCVERRRALLRRPSLRRAAPPRLAWSRAG